MATYPAPKKQQAPIAQRGAVTRAALTPEARKQATQRANRQAAEAAARAAALTPTQRAVTTRRVRINLGELRELTKDLPDSVQITVDVDI